VPTIHSFAPGDSKFVSCSDDVKIKIWDFKRGEQEQLLEGHGWDVKSVSWHPYRSLIVSGSKDNLVKVWDAKSGKNVATMYDSV
jgi:polyadenylation factor subunit 2